MRAVRVLAVAPQPFFSPRGTPFSVYYRSLVMAEAGAEIDLLTYGQGQDVDIPGVSIHRIPAFRFLGPVPIGPSMLKLFLDVFMVIWTLGLLLRRRYDVVHAHEESVFYLRFLKPIFRFRLIYDMHSSLPQQLSNFQYTRSRFLTGLFQRLEDTCLRTADAVITICPELATYALGRMSRRERHFLIENSVLEPVRLKQESEEKGEVSLLPLPRDRTIIGYAGTFEPYQGLDILIRAFGRARESRPEAFLLMVGGTEEQVAGQRALARELGLEAHTLFTGQVEQAAARAYMERALVLTSPRSEGTNTPLKVYEQLASGKPLVATRILSHTQVLGEEVCFLVDPDPESMAEGLLAALEGGETVERVVAAARELYEREYSRPAYERKIHALLEAVA